MSDGYKISKNKSPWGDSFFSSKLGLGVADGVGGWITYGIDPSSFSEMLMKECCKYVSEKERKLSQFIWKPGNMSITLDDSYDSDELPLYNPKFNEIFNTLDISRKRPLRRNSSSFHLDEKSLNACEDSIDSKIDETTPRSDSTCKDYDTFLKNLRLEPRHIMKEAYRKVDAHGSSTAWIAVIQNKILKVANLGDSTWILVRYSFSENKSKVLLKTEEQHHNFNAPYQLSNLPENLKSVGIFDSEYSAKPKFWKDKPSDSVLYQSKVEEGDIVICATDGLFDNLFINEILNIVDVFISELISSSSIPSLYCLHNYSKGISQELRNEWMTLKNAKRLAKVLVQEAYRKSRSQVCFTPFGKKFSKLKIMKDKEILRWNGGKLDDIWAVVGFIKSWETLYI